MSLALNWVRDGGEVVNVDAPVLTLLIGGAIEPCFSTGIGKFSRC
jgi:hypothetical protein